MAVSVVDAIAFGLDNDIAGMNPVGMNVYGAFDSVNAASSYADFFAPLKTTLVLSRGTGSPTFTRATTAYVKDFEDVWRQVPSGAARFEGARVVVNGCPGYRPLSGFGTTETSTTIDDPLGGSNAGRYRIDNAASYQRYFTFSSLSGTTVVGSAYLRGVGTSVGKSVGLWLYDNGTTVSAVVTLTSDWKRFTPAARTNTTGGVDCRIGIAGFIGGTIALNEEVDICCGQGENVTGASNQAPSEWVSKAVLSAPYHGAGADGIKYFATENGNSVASNVVTEATGAAIPDATLKGYFSEGQRQNRCIHAQDFTNAAWVSGGGGIAVTPNTAVAPDGTTTADTLTASGANGTLIQDLGVVASAAKAGGLYLKRKTGTGNIDLTLDGGATWTTVAVTSSWLLLEKTQTLADEDFGIRIVTSGDEVYSWQGQVETAAFISSVIPTTTAAVTRNASVISYPSSGNIAAAAGAVYLEFTPQHAPVGTIALFGTYVDANNYTAILHDATNLIFRKRIAASNYDATIANAFVAGTTYKVAASWGSGGTSIVLDGTVGTPHANTTNAQIGTTIQIGADGNGAQQPFASIKNSKLWQTAKTDAQLQALTT